MSIDLSHFRQVFIEESLEGISLIENALRAPESADNAVLGDLFRTAHSLKSGAAMFEFGALIPFSARTEALFEQIHQQQKALTPELAGLLLEACDALRLLLHSGDINHLPDSVEALDRRLQAVSDQPSCPAIAEPAAATAPEPAATESKTAAFAADSAPIRPVVAAPPSQPSGGVDLSRFRTLFFEESLEGVEQLESALLQLDGDTSEALSSAFRAAHSIKGGAGMFSFDSVVELSHATENLLNRLRTEPQQLTPERTQLLLGSADAIRELLLHARDELSGPTPEFSELQQRLCEALRQPGAELAASATEAVTGTRPAEVTAAESDRSNSSSVISIESTVSAEADPFAADPFAADPFAAEPESADPFSSDPSGLEQPTSAGQASDPASAAGVLDLSQFTAVFFEEGFEAVETMEAGLLKTEAGDEDAIDDVFRAAHSVKGGAGMFDFNRLVDFTHLMESLLGEIRSGKRQPTAELTSLLLEATDGVRTLLQQAQQGDSDLPPALQRTQEQLQSTLNNSPTDDSEPTAAAPPSEPSQLSGNWQIIFSPHRSLLRNGNEPLYLLSALRELGEANITCDSSALPPFGDLDCSDCWLRWQIELIGTVSRQAVEEVFAWAEDDCELRISALETDGAALQTPTDGPTALASDTSDTGSPAGSPSESVHQGQERRRKTDRRSSDRRAGAETTSFRVSTEKIDTLINRVGELLITESMLTQFDLDKPLNKEQLELLREGLARLQRNSREIQQDVMQIRMLPISFVFNRFPRLVHDLQARLGKQIELTIRGENTELDKTLLEKISDPLVHLVRNAIDHGIEAPEQRRAAGKSDAGQLQLEARHQGGNIVIEVCDDGAGLDTEKILARAREQGLIGESEALQQAQVYELIMEPGFSTTDQVSDLSGRGVGMDVVRQNINELGGNIDIDSQPALGTRMRITLPLTLAIVDGQQVRLHDQTFIIPLISIVESIPLAAEQVRAIAGRDRLLLFRDDYIPLISLRGIMSLPPAPEEETLVVIVEVGNQYCALLVDELLQQQQVVIKSLEDNYRKVEGIAGATILGNGRVALIFDIAGIVQLYRRRQRRKDSRPDSNIIQLRVG